MQTIQSIAPSLLAFILVTPVLEETSPALEFKEATTIQQTWSIQRTSESSVATLTIGGNDQDIGSGSTTTQQRSLDFKDTVKAADEGALRGFERSYEQVISVSETEGLDDSAGVRIADKAESSRLEGESVLFTFDEDSEEFESEFGEDSTGEEEWLDGLRAMSFLDGVLPDEAVEVGSSWDVEPGFLGELLSPGGDVDHRAPTEEPEDKPEGAIALVVPTPGGHGAWSEMDGTIGATFESIDKNEEGLRLAKIVLEIDASGDFDLIEELATEAEERGSADDYDSAELERTVKGELVIFWDLDGKRPHAVTGELEGTTAFNASWTVDAGGFQLEAETERQSEDSYVIEATFAWTE